MSPLHYAAQYNSEYMIERLLSAGANINEKDIIYQILTILLLIKFI